MGNVVYHTEYMRSASDLEASSGCTETLSRSCMLSCMKVTGAPCTELSNMCEVDAVALSRRPVASEIQELLFWASNQRKKRFLCAKAFNTM